MPISKRKEDRLYTIGDSMNRRLKKPKSKVGEVTETKNEVDAALAEMSTYMKSRYYDDPAGAKMAPKVWLEGNAEKLAKYEAVDPVPTWNEAGYDLGDGGNVASKQLTADVDLYNKLVSQKGEVKLLISDAESNYMKSLNKYKFKLKQSAALQEKEKEDVNRRKTGARGMRIPLTTVAGIKGGLGVPK